MYNYTEVITEFIQTEEKFGLNIYKPSLESVGQFVWTGKTKEDYDVKLVLHSSYLSEYRISVTKPSGYQLHYLYAVYKHKHETSVEFACDLLEHHFGFAVYVEGGEK